MRLSDLPPGCSVFDSHINPEDPKYGQAPPCQGCGQARRDWCFEHDECHALLPGWCVKHMCSEEDAGVPEGDYAEYFGGIECHA